jgi:hypothetical protein
VVDVAEDVVREELLGGAELTAGSMGVVEQSERATASEALVEEDGGREIPWPGFASRRCGQALGVGGAQG